MPGSTFRHSDLKFLLCIFTCTTAQDNLCSSFPVETTMQSFHLYRHRRDSNPSNKLLFLLHCFSKCYCREKLQTSIALCCFAVLFWASTWAQHVDNLVIFNPTIYCTWPTTTSPWRHLWNQFWTGHWSKVCKSGLGGSFRSLLSYPEQMTTLNYDNFNNSHRDRDALYCPSHRTRPTVLHVSAKKPQVLSWSVLKLEEHLYRVTWQKGELRFPTDNDLFVLAQREVL